MSIVELPSFIIDKPFKSDPSLNLYDVKYMDIFFQISQGSANGMLTFVCFLSFPCSLSLTIELKPQHPCKTLKHDDCSWINLFV